MMKFNDTLLRAARGEQVEHTPVWFMRQAGRSQPEYREIKQKYSLEEITMQPELCAYVTRLPVEQYNVDAAILYKDIVTPLPGMGVDVKIKAGIGPVISNPIRSVADVENLGEFNAKEHTPYVLETIKMLTKEQLNVPLIGFGGAPFTLASYMIEGGPSRNYAKTKSFMVSQPKAWIALMDKLADMIIADITAQVEAGAKAIQIFDSWVGALNVEDYRIFIKPTMTRIFAELRALNVPLIQFGVGASHLVNEWHDLPIRSTWRYKSGTRELGSYIITGRLERNRSTCKRYCRSRFSTYRRSYFQLRSRCLPGSRSSRIKTTNSICTRLQPRTNCKAIIIKR